MRLPLLALACFAAFSIAPAGARAETAQERFERLVNEPGNTDALAYVDGSISGPVLAGGVPFSEHDDVFGTGSVFLQRATRGGISETMARTSLGRFDMHHQALRSEAAATADASGGFRDVWTFGGGTGTGTLEVRGFIDASVGGEGLSRINTHGTLSTTGSFGRGDASFAASFVGPEGRIVADTRCGAAFNSSCQTGVAQGTAQLLWSLSIPFEYGGRASFVQRLFTGTESVNPKPLGLLDVQAFITGIVLPEGATLTAASHRVVFSDGAWVYADRPVTPPVPEPATWGLMLAGLAVLLGARPRARGRRVHGVAP